MAELELNLSTADPVPAGTVILGRHRRGNDTNSGLQEGSAFFGSFDFGLTPLSGAAYPLRGQAQRRFGGWFATLIVEAADAACGPGF